LSVGEGRRWRYGGCSAIADGRHFPVYARIVPNDDSRENWQQTFATNPESKKLPLAVVPAHFRRATHVLLATIALHSDYS
jgi:hypothetical protein